MLARWRETCFVTWRLARFGIKSLMSGARIFAGAIVLLVFLAANSGLHQALHHSGNAAPDSCVLCLLAKGQVDLPDTTTAPNDSVRSVFDLAPRVESIVLVDFTYLTAPSRAPPALSSLLPAVA